MEIIIIVAPLFWVRPPSESSKGVPERGMVLDEWYIFTWKCEEKGFSKKKVVWKEGWLLNNMSFIRGLHFIIREFILAKMFRLNAEYHVYT